MKNVDNMRCVMYDMTHLYNKSVNAKNKSDHNKHTYTPSTLTTLYNIYTYTNSPIKKLKSASITQILIIKCLHNNVVVVVK